MLLEDAVALRIEQLCIERGMSKYDLFLKSGVPQSTLTSIKKKRSLRRAAVYAHVHKKEAQPLRQDQNAVCGLRGLFHQPERIFRFAAV